MIRHADLQDFDRIMEMMISFANAAPVAALHNPDYQYRRIQHFLSHILTSGCIILGVDDSDVAQGMLIASIQPDPWLPYVNTLTELAWWVEPEYRNTTMGYRLLKEYTKFGEQLKQQGTIDNFTLTLMSVSPDMNLQKRGWRAVETNYVYEGN
jgi:RimJ/RimL family protein N-acetyltransferase